MSQNLVHMKHRSQTPFNNWCELHRTQATLLSVAVTVALLSMGLVLELVAGQAVAFIFVCLQIGASSVAISTLIYKKILNKAEKEVIAKNLRKQIKNF